MIWCDHRVSGIAPEPAARVDGGGAAWAGLSAGARAALTTRAVPWAVALQAGSSAAIISALRSCCSVSISTGTKLSKRSFWGCAMAFSHVK
eukprot:CAMPEP_0113562344 /NCGR_PEP_ID=MMETSP0015_2-20120614/20474_1 /TAXON_ID=2838 /ORGANISM="Odontella" /LENGTH=90 /DNA_ID=CAMNT_0000464229 /DNA_START=2108 /DNA_END=2381 /DNA_ORIENTATION=+ /assembly_acc=CAM_ASM_000160